LHQKDKQREWWWFLFNGMEGFKEWLWKEGKR
jgi:hypothetical protein